MGRAPQTTDADRNCISNIRPDGIGYADAAFKLAHLLNAMRKRQVSGVALKDDSDRLAIDRVATNHGLRQRDAIGTLASGHGVSSLGIRGSHSVKLDVNEADLKALRAAVQLLEHPGLPARLAGMVGKPLDLLATALPPGATQAVSAATQKGLEAALKVAVLTMKEKPVEGSRLLHKSLAVASGAFGGAFGLTTLPIELPVSTIIMLRSIADIARSEGEEPARSRHRAGVPAGVRAGRRHAGR